VVSGKHILASHHTTVAPKLIEEGTIEYKNCLLLLLEDAIVWKEKADALAAAEHPEAARDH
jgi:hypothetical protein